MNGILGQDEIIDLERRYVPISLKEKDKEILEIRFKSKKLDFNGLAQHLKALAKKIESEVVGVERLEVVGIDFT